MPEGCNHRILDENTLDKSRLIHHFFTFPRWIVIGGYEPNLTFATLFNSPTKLCVCIFAFINGWTFVFNPVSWKNALQKTKKLIINYWSIAIPALVIAIVICKYQLTVSDVLLELLGLSSKVMIFAWYVPFYCVSVLVLTGIQRIMNRDVKAGIAVGIIIPIILFGALKTLPFSNEIKTLFNNLKHWFPCISVGYMSYKYGWIKKLNKFTRKINRHIISASLIALCFVGRYFVSALDFVYCLFLVYAIVNLQIGTESIPGKILRICGRNSSNMWFLHCLYFGEATRTLFQPLVFLVVRPTFIFLIAVVELLTTSEIINGIKTRIVEKMSFSQRN